MTARHPGPVSRIRRLLRGARTASRSRRVGGGSVVAGSAATGFLLRLASHAPDSRSRRRRSERLALGSLAAGLVLAGGLLAHALDEEGLLPGVRESERIREFGERGPARPLLLLGCVLVAALVGALVARADRRPGGVPPRMLLGLVVGGQATLFASFEVVARLRAGLDVAEMFAEPAFATGFCVQCLIAAAFVALLLLTALGLRGLLAAPRLSWQPYGPAYVTRTATRAGTRRPEAPPRGRAPPFGIVTCPVR